MSGKPPQVPDSTEAMKLRKWGHACIAVERAGTTIVIDPGEYTEPNALREADAVLITHEHADHFDEAKLRAAAARNPGLKIWTNRSVAAKLDGLGDRTTVVGDGDVFAVGEIEVEVHGELHDLVHASMPPVPNVGFFLAGQVFHPGDALTLLGRPVDILLLPIHAPWSRTGEVIDYLDALRPRVAVGIHDGGLSAMGAAVVDGILNGATAADSTEYVRVASGERGATLAVSSRGRRGSRRAIG